MRMSIIGMMAAHDGHVRLRGGFVVERKRILDTYDPARRQRRPQRIARHVDAGRMRAALRLGDDQLPADELDRLALQRADVDQSLVFNAPPALRGERRLLHGRSVAMPVCMVNASE